MANLLSNTTIGGYQSIHTGNIGSYAISSSGGTITGQLYINNGDPTIFLVDTNHRSAMIHVNSNTFYVLRGAGTNSTGWATSNGYWPLTISLEDNNATFGGTVAAPAGDFRAPIFYDSADTGYYLDLNSTSYLYHLILSGNSYFRPNSWIQFDGNYGVYWPNHYGLHIYPNQSSYGSLQVKGSKGGWHGIHFDSNNTLMVNANESGFHNDGYGWQFRWTEGTMYVHRGTYGGGSYYTVIDSGNVSNFMPTWGAYSWTSPVFGQYGVKSNLIDNVLYSAADRFEVFRDGAAWNTNCLFNLNYDQNCDVIAVNTSRTYSIILNTKGNGASGITYTEGTVYLSFYYVYIPGSVSGRVKDQNGVWRNIDSWTNVANNGSYAVWRGNVPSFNYMVEMEITINANSSNNTWFAQWEYVMGRPGQYELGVFNKAQDNSVWRSLYFRDSSNVARVTINSGGISANTVTSNNFNVSNAIYFGGGNNYLNWTNSRIYSNVGIESADSLRAPIFYDSQDSNYYADFNSTVNNAIRVRGGMLMGPNPTWGAYLQVGGDGNNSSYATMSVTNGNIHIDPKNGYNLYLNHYYGSKIYFGSGGSAGGSNHHSNFSGGGNLNLGGGESDASYRLQVSGTGYASSDFRAPIFYDSQDTNYYLDPNSTSRLGTLNINQLSVYGNTYLGDGNGDEVHINDILRVGATDSGDAHIFFGEGGSAGSDYGAHLYWDSGYRFTWYTRNAGTDSTLFYYDTNSLSYITWGRSLSMNTNSIDYTGQLHFSGGTRFQSIDTHYLKFRTDATDYGSIQVRDANESIKGYLGYFDANGFGLLNSSGSWGIRLTPGNGDTVLYSGGNWKLTTTSAGISVNGNVYIDQNYGHGIVGLYASDRYQGVFAMGDSYKLSADGTSPGSLYGIAWTHTNVGGESKSGLGHQALFMTNGNTQTAIGTGIWTNGLITTTSYGTSANWKSAYDWGNHASAGYISTSYLDDYTRGSYRVISDYGGNTTWYLRGNGQFIWGLSHDWSYSFRLNLPSGSQNNSTWAYFGQQDSNAGSGTWRGVRIRKYASGSVDGDLSAGAFYIGDTRKDENWDSAYSWGNHASAGYVTSSALSSYVPLSGATLTEGNYFYFRSNRGSYLGALDSPSLQVYASGGNAAFMSFHRGGNYAVNFGLDSDNVMRIGGWSAAADRWVLDMSGNNTVAGSFRAPIFYDSANTNFYGDFASTSVMNSIRFGTSTNNATLSGASTWGVTLTTDSGWIQFGPANGSWAHIYASQSFYFNQDLYVNGNVVITSATIGSQSVSYASTAGSADQIDGRGFVNTGSNNATYADSINSNGISYVAFNISLLGQTDGALYSQAYDSAWQHQIYGDYRTGQIVVRGKLNGTWQAWRTVIDSSTIGSQSVSYATTAGSLSSMNISQFTNNSGYLTGITSGQVTGALGYTPYNSSNPSGYITSSGSISGNAATATYATTAGSAPNGGNINQFYNVSAGVGNGLSFWNGSSAYKISMGVGSLYQYGPVSDYSIKMQMNDGDTGRGFTWGRESYAPIAALNSTSGDMEVAGYYKSYGYRGNGNVGGTGTASWHPDGIYCGSTMWQYAGLYKNNTGIYGVSEIQLNAGLYLQTYNDRNLIVKGNSSSDAGIEGRNAAGSNVFQIYGSGSDYGFLNGTWAAWDIRKTKNGALYMNDTSGYYLYTNGTSNFYALNIQGSAVIHAGNIGSQSVSYASSAGSVAWTNVSSRPTALSQFTNDLGNYGGWITSSGSITGNASKLDPLSGDSNYKLAYTADGARTNAGEWGRAVMYYVPNGQTYGIRVDRADYADSAGGVAWTNVSSRPTALSQFSNDLGNYGGWITSSGSISGNAATATNVAWSGVTSKPAAWLDGGAMVQDMEPSATAFPSGFYQSYLGAGNPTGTWFNYINVRHSNTGNGHGFQLGMSYYDTNLWFRSYQGGTSPTFSAWNYAIHSGNIGSQSVNYANSAGSASSATNAGQLNTYGYLVGENWNDYYTSGKLRVASVSGSTSANCPPNVHNYGGLLSYGIAGEDSFQLYFPDNAADSIANSRRLHYRTGRNGGWSSWRTVVDMVGDTLTIVEGPNPKIVVRGSAGYGSPSSASIELVGDADGGYTQSYRWISNASDWAGQEFRLERKVNNSFQLVGRVPKNTNNLEWQGTIVQGLSDSRVKSNVVSMTGGLDKIDQIRPVTFDWVPTENVSDREGADFGFIAQELEEVLPEVVHTRGDGYKTVMYEKVVPVLVQAMKEQQAMIDALKAEIELLKNK